MVDGIGRTKAAQIKASFELGRRLMQTPTEKHPQVKTPADMANLLIPRMRFLEREELWLMLMNARSRVTRIQTLYKGNLNSLAVRVNEIFAPAIQQNAFSIAIAHNHPSGDPTPSTEDIHFTRQLVKAGQLLQIKLEDHIVIGDNKYVSLRERGLVNFSSFGGWEK